MISEIIQSINDQIDTIDVSVKEVYSIARILDTTEEKYPAIYKGANDWDRISIDNSVKMLVYHRVNGISQEDDDEAFDFRTSLAVEVKEIYEMSMIIVLEKSYDYDKAIEIKNIMPNFIVNTNYAVVYVVKEELEVDEDDIINDEFGETDYLRYKSDFNVFKLNYRIELINC